MDVHVPHALAGDGQLLSPPQHGGRRVGHGVAADVHGVPLPGVKDGLIALELWGVCEDHGIWSSTNRRKPTSHRG